ncbi:Aminopeptidase YwaD [Calidithermus terrae]|uniref:Aminopeptidase YwaD n=1 Tax=Calidithermus terrae TaxID=1408545 RepID=A0A399EFS4_9DEIN|nr:M28 family metallopeptidase [Calidithermus terrae]RIH82413.1 Aminopeptidase YwaD [Calidithermus terrae]
MKPSLWTVLLLSFSVLAFAPERAKADLDYLVGIGPRVAGSPAAAQAAEYLAAQARAAGYAVEFQPFSYTRSRDTGSSLSLGPTRLEALALSGSPGGTFEAPLQAVPGVGAAGDYAGLDVRGKIVVVRRGVIPFLEKARQAAAQGAVAVVVVNNEPGAVRGTYGGVGPIPGVTVSGSEGEALFARSGERARLVVGAVLEQAQARNVIARRPDSSAPSVVVGGHYDSVQGAPGANDNASGTVTVLELARSLAGEGWAKDVWYVWFDGEEDGLWGSRNFVQAFPERVRGLKAMLNLDMVGVRASPALGVGGDAALLRLLEQSGAQFNDIGNSGGSDHVPFAQAGVPVLFFHWGIDPNYHQPTDTVADPKLLAETAVAVRAALERILKQ